MIRKLGWDDVSESLDLPRVLDELGIQVTDRYQKWLMASCPLPSHPGNDDNPSFGVNEEGLSFNCFVCGGGSLPTLVIEIEEFEDGEEEIDSAWQQALRWLSQFSDVDSESEFDAAFTERIKETLGERSIRRVKVRREPLPVFSPSVLTKIPPVELTDLRKWQIKRESTVSDFVLGFDMHHKRHEYVGPALIIPHFWEGDLVGYQERWYDDDRPKNIPKYTNTNGFPKKETLFNWDRAVIAARQGKAVIVVESAMTVVRLHDIDLPAVGTFGATLSERQIALLSSLGCLFLSFDNDPSYLNAKGKRVQGAGRKATKKIGDQLSETNEIFIMDPVLGLKGDLADASEDEIFELIEGAKSYYMTL